MEIGFAMALAGFIGFAAIINVDAAFSLVAKDIFSVFSSYGFTVIPMFVLMGQIGASGEWPEVFMILLTSLWVISQGARYRNNRCRHDV